MQHFLGFIKPEAIKAEEHTTDIAWPLSYEQITVGTIALLWQSLLTWAILAKPHHPCW